MALGFSDRLETPMLTVTEIVRPSLIGTASCSMPRRSRSVTMRATSMSVARISRANSSPPTRASMSYSRSIWASLRATSTSTWSPAWWPQVSLTFLKWSISSMQTDSEPPPRRENDSSRRSSSSKYRRLKAPVRLSRVIAWN